MLSPTKESSEKSPVFTLDQEQAFYHFINTKQNLFITGGAGTGKSFLLRHFLEAKKTTEKIPVLASTGAAAILIGGRTFHSFFGLGIMQGGADAVLEKALENKRLRKRLNEVSEIVIDEISMLSWETLDCAERIARALRKCEQPWGGIRIVAVGDFAQLPPIGRAATFSNQPGGLGGATFGDSRKEWAFLGEAWAASEFKKIVLKEVMRTEDANFLQILEDLRFGHLSVRLKFFLDHRVRKSVDTEITHLFPRRNQTEAFNLARLHEIETKERRYETVYGGDARYFDQLKKDAPIPPVLNLKKGAFVMVRVNDPKQRFVNGTVGRILSLEDDVIVIDSGNHKKFELEPFAFSVQDADGNEVAFAKNFPVQLAYASTIHKIQGATLDKVHIDMGGLWEPGHAYVALSRVRRAEDATLIRWSARSILSDPLVLSFYGHEAKAKAQTFDDPTERELQF